MDDHGIFREGTALLLKSLDPSVEVSHARTARECLDTAAAGNFDLVLLDLGLPDKPGQEALSDLKHAHPDLPVVVLSGHEDRETVLESIKRGAMGFIPKSSDDPKLLWHALKMALSGTVTVPASVSAIGESHTLPQQVLPQEIESRAVRSQDLGLTARQFDVLRLLVQGLPNKSIAPHALLLIAFFIGDLVELRENIRLMLRRDADAGIAHRDFHFRTQCDFAQHYPVALSVFDGVVD